MLERVFSGLGLDVAAKSMELLKKKHKCIASNIANADTPGYRAQRFEFEKQLQAAVYGSDELPLYTTHPRHIPSAPPSLEEVEGRAYRVFWPLRNDENSVDVDREMAKLAENQILYNSIAQAFALQVAKLKYAIGGGR